MPSLSNVILAAASTIIRLAAYLFLRWIPGHHFPPTIFALLAIYLTTIVLGDSGPLARPSTSTTTMQNGGRGEKKLEPNGRPAEDSKSAWRVFIILLSGIPHPSFRWPSALTVASNILLALSTADMVFRPLLYPSNNLRFARVGHVMPEAVKILIREPETARLPLILSYQPMGSDAWTEAGKLHKLDESTDFTSGITLNHLSPDTSYSYRFSNNLTGDFTTPPAASDSVTFLTSSCIKARFPYSPFIDPLEIRGFHYLRSVLEKLPSSSKFMLFLGDFIYVDVPWRMSFSVSHYRSEYRRVYSSPSWSLSSAIKDLPWLHTLDDHEIANDWSGGSQQAPYPAAADPFWHYHVAVNPSVPSSHSPGNVTFFSWARGPASFFMLDTRTYRTDPEPNPDATILGPDQLSALIDFILQPPGKGVRWKFIASSVPFTKNWRVGTSDTWGGFLKERAQVLTAMHTAEAELGVRIVILSGDRHEFGAVRFPRVDATTDLAGEEGPHEFSVGPLSMFYLPVPTFKQTDEEDVIIEYLPAGNSKVGVVDITSVTNRSGTSVSRMVYTLYIDGEDAWNYELDTPL